MADDTEPQGEAVEAQLALFDLAFPDLHQHYVAAAKIGESIAPGIIPEVDDTIYAVVRLRCKETRRTMDVDGRLVRKAVWAWQSDMAVLADEDWAMAKLADAQAEQDAREVVAEARRAEADGVTMIAPDEPGLADPDERDPDDLGDLR